MIALAGLDKMDEVFQEAFEITDPADFVIAKRVDFESTRNSPTSYCSTLLVARNSGTVSETRECWLKP